MLNVKSVRSIFFSPTSTLTAFLLLFLTLSDLSHAEEKPPISTIAFGSCAKQDRPQPIWDAVVAAQPDLFLFIGDNIYGDTEDMEILKNKYEQLGRQTGYQKLKNTCPILATWDDHDYGGNDAGVEYPKKKESQQTFLDFFGEPADSPRRKREGVYDAKVFGREGKRVQIILLDTRYFRSPLVRADRTSEPGEGDRGPYAPNRYPSATMLGRAQWAWLDQQLQVPADIRVIASSIQVIADDHGWEKWGNFPHERKHLFDLIAQTGAKGVIFISGDRHSAEISAINSDDIYTLYDITSSSLNAPLKWRNELNRHRIGLKYFGPNFGVIMIGWEEENPTIRLQVRGEKGKVVLQKRIRLSELQRKGG